MAAEATEMPAPELVCTIPECTKKYKRKTGLSNHMASVHQMLVSNVLSPMATSARTLFGGNSVSQDESTQGNSAGAVNSPKVRSAAALLCGVCDEAFPGREEVNKHMNEEHDEEESSEADDNALNRQHDDNAPNEENDDALNELSNEDEEGLENAMDEYELYEALNVLTQSVEDPEKVIQLQDKLKRYQNIMKKKNVIQKSIVQELKTAKHDSAMRAQVEVKQSKQLDEKDRAKEKLVKEVKLMKTQLKEKDIIIKQLQEAHISEDSEDIEIVQQIVNMDKQTKGYKCNACNKNFRKNEDLERHMEARHAEQICLYCDNKFSSEQALVKHHDECVDFGVRTATCNKCDKYFTNFALKKHRSKCQGQQQEVDCPECGEICKTTAAMRKHYDSNHKSDNVSSREVCKWWKMGKCNNKRCKYAHVGYQIKNGSEPISTHSTKVPACKNGSRCEWLEKGKCSFFHKGVGIQKPWVQKDIDHEDRGRGIGKSRTQQMGHPERSHRPNRGQAKPRGQSGDSRWDRSDQSDCRFDGRCERIPNCPHFHSLQNFPILQGRKQGGIRNQNQRRN